MRELILTFHGLGEPPAQLTDAERKVWVPVDWFEAIVVALPASGVQIAFDDGNASDVACALPALEKAGRTARFFVLAGRIGAPGFLDEDGISRLHAAGMTIGSHGLAHHDWRALPGEELERELVDSKLRLSELVGGRVDEAACPFGSYDRRVLRALREAGYRRVYTSDGGSTSTGAWLAARTSVHRDRPLPEWISLARGTSRALRPDPVLVAKQLVKRWR